MKGKRIKYSIEEPCHEDWNEMKPEAKGRFCSSCSKTVVDFSSMSDFSIVSYLEGKKNESVCGRFRPAQMDKFYSLPKPHQQFHFDLKAVALGLALSTFSSIHLDAQVTLPIENIDTLNVINEPIDGMVSVREFYDHTDEKFVRGKVLVSGNRFEQITIQLMNDKSEEISKITLAKDGTFKVPLDWSKNPTYIMISGSDFTTEQRYLIYEESITSMKILLHEEIMIKGNVKSQDK